MIFGDHSHHCDLKDIGSRPLDEFIDKDVFEDLESGKTLFINDEPSSKASFTTSKSNNGTHPVYADVSRPHISMWGSGNPSSTVLIIYKAYAVIIGFYAQEYLKTLLEEVDGLDIFVFMIALLAIWKYISDPTREWILRSVHDGGYGWKDNLLNIIEFLSYLVVYVVFGYFGRILFAHANNVGVNITEITLIGFAGAIYAYDIYRFASIEVASHS